MLINYFNSVAYKWSQKEDFESKLKEEVVIVTDAKLRIVLLQTISSI
jgi:hypothetical protein